MNANVVRHDGHSSCGLVLLASFEPRRDMNPGPADTSFESQPEHAEQQALQEPADPGSDDATSTSSASPQILHEALRFAGPVDADHDLVNTDLVASNDEATNQGRAL